MKETRKVRAAHLLKQITEGPHFSFIGPKPDSPEVQYRRWARSWILDDLIDLVPELREQAKQLRLREEAKT